MFHKDEILVLLNQSFPCIQFLIPNIFDVFFFVSSKLTTVNLEKENNLFVNYVEMDVPVEVMLEVIAALLALNTVPMLEAVSFATVKLLTRRII